MKTNKKKNAHLVSTSHIAYNISEELIIMFVKELAPHQCANNSYSSFELNQCALPPPIPRLLHEVSGVPTDPLSPHLALSPHFCNPRPQ